MEKMSMKRRQFLLTSLGIGSIFVCPSIGATTSSSLPGQLNRLYPETHLYKEIAHHLSDAELKAHGKATLISSLAGRLDIVGSSLSDNAIQLALANANKEDFIAGRVRSVQGWLLSETELNLCLLLAQPSDH